jgi:hypothetical protein
MGERFVRDYDDENIVTEEYVTEEPGRPNPGIWVAAFLLFACLGAATWFWYQAETNQNRPLAVIGQDGPKIIVDADADAPARYVIVREGNTSRVVGGTSVATVDGSNPNDAEATRAQKIASYTTNDVTEFVGPQAASDRIGQTVTIMNGVVHEATGDKTFSLHADNDKTLLVFFPEPNTRRGETAYKIIGGDTVSVTGTVRKMPSPTEARRVFGLSETEAAALSNQNIYIDAYRIEVK